MAPPLSTISWTRHARSSSEAPPEDAPPAKATARSAGHCPAARHETDTRPGDGTMITLHRSDPVSQRGGSPQKAPICAAKQAPRLGTIGVQIGGSARGYQELSAPLTIPTTAGQTGDQTVCLYSVGAGSERALLPLSARWRDGEYLAARK